jgi:DNA-binding CsgD family transcriptional regulator
VSTGDAALGAGHWSAARDAFADALEEDETAEALLGLGEALWWLGLLEDSVRHRERAYALLRRRPDPARAAEVAIRLCLTHRASLGNRAVAAGWLARAARLVDEHGLEPLGGWVALMRAGAGDDPSSSGGWAREALRVARRCGDADLELCALSQAGSALVRAGRVTEGVALLDEAMAGSLGGEVRSLHTVVFTSCQMMVSCSRAAEFERAGQWIQAADDFTRRYGCPFLFTVCRTLYGGVLLATGRWASAEEELTAALGASRRGQRALFGDALAKLAELRLAQGRVEEAERLLEGFEDHPAAAAAMAGIHMARGSPAAATSILGRRARELGEDSLEGAVLVELLVEAEIAQGAVEAATARARRLAELGARRGSEAMAARGDRSLGRALAAQRRAEEARPRLDAALTAFTRLEMPLEAGRTHLLLASALADRDPEAAIAEARAALGCFEQLGAAADADAAAATLRSLGVRAARAGSRDPGILTRREVEVLGLVGEGLSNREIAERLFLSRKTVEHHVARVLAKLSLRSRAEAAAYAVRRLGGDSAPG